VARQVAQATGSFEHLLLGRPPTSVTVVVKGDSMVITIHETFSDVERRLARDDQGRHRVRDFHRYLFDTTLDLLREHVEENTGVQLHGALAHVDMTTGSVVKTLTTDADIELFLLGEGLPMLGVPVDAHLHAPGSDGRGPVRH